MICRSSRASSPPTNRAEPSSRNSSSTHSPEPGKKGLVRMNRTVNRLAGQHLLRATLLASLAATASPLLRADQWTAPTKEELSMTSHTGGPRCRRRLSRSRGDNGGQAPCLERLCSSQGSYREGQGLRKRRADVRFKQQWRRLHGWRYRRTHDSSRRDHRPVYRQAIRKAHRKDPRAMKASSTWPRSLHCRTSK